MRITRTDGGAMRDWRLREDKKTPANKRLYTIACRYMITVSEANRLGEIVERVDGRQIELCPWKRGRTSP